MNNSAKEVASAFYDGMATGAFDEVFEKYIAEDVVNHTGGFDRATWLATEKDMLAGFDPRKFTVLDVIAEGDRVMTRFEVGGTHIAEFFGVKPLGNTAYMTVVAIDRVVDGKILEHWAEYDFPTFLGKLQAGEN